MKWYRERLRKSRLFVLSLVAMSLYAMVEPWNFVHAQQVREREQAHLQRISDKLGIPVDELRPDHRSLFEALQRALGLEAEDPVKKAGVERLRAVLGEHRARVEANPYRPQIEQVRREHALARIDGAVGDLLRLTAPAAGENLSPAAQRALLLSLEAAVAEGVTLPALDESLPARAHARHAEMQAKLDRLFGSLEPALAGAPGTGTVAQKVAQLRFQQQGSPARAIRPPRYAERSLPLRRIERKAEVRDLSTLGAREHAAVSSALATAPATARAATKAVAPEIAALAQSLGNTPARIFSWVHDNVAYDPKWGADKSPLGTLHEKLGTSWDQAWLLAELLEAAGVDARMEWGEVEISPATLMELAGVSDPFVAGDLLTTAGIPIVLFTQGSQVVVARMDHVWVKAFIDYIPDRGATAGAGDTWVRMDPSLKRFDIAEGIRIHDQVPFSLGAYLQSGTTLSPRRFYEDALWQHIRAESIDCTDLGQLAPAPRIRSEAFPFVPGTLRAEIVAVAGEATDVPAAFQQRLDLVFRDAFGVQLLSWSTAWPSVFGQRVEIAWPGATADDQATLDANGGVFETPPYLVDLRPSIRIDGVEAASGTAVGSAEDVTVLATVTPPNGPPTVVDFDLFAGERSVIALDFAQLPQEVLDGHLATITAATAAGDESLAEAATLALAGAVYMRILSRDLDDLAGFKWQRLVKAGTIGMVMQRGTVSTTVDGSPISFTRGPTTVDIASMPLGIFPADGVDGFLVETFELLGSQSSYLEGEALTQVVEDETMTAVTFLTRAVREGQTLTLVDGSNLDAALAAAELGDSVEAEVRAGVEQGKVAWIAETELTINQWRGSGYVIEDPATGAAGYLGTGGYGVADTTGRAGNTLAESLGGESWHSSGPFARALKAAFGDPRGGDSTDSDPINISNGNMYHGATDLWLMIRRMPVKWERTYNSRSDRNGPLGYGWTFSYGERLEAQGDGSMLYLEADGTEHLYAADGAGGFTTPAGKNLDLTALAGGFTLRSKEGGERRFDADGKPVALVDHNGNTVTLTYDGAGNLATVIDAAGRVALTVTHDGSHITAIQDLDGRTVTFGYDGDDLTSVIDSENQTWTYTYDDRHNMVARADPLGHAHTFAFDALDRCVRHANPLGEGESIAYSDRGRRAVVTDARGFTRFTEFDERGRITLDVDPLGNASRSTWDEDNNRVATVDARGGVTTRTYDDRGNMLSQSDPLGRTSTFTYDPVHSRVLTETDAAGDTVTNEYDPQGNMLRATTEVSGVVRVTEMTYDSFGNPATILDADGGLTTLTYDPVTGALDTQTDSLGAVTETVTNALGQITGLTNPVDDTLSVSFDQLGRVVGMVDYHGDAWDLDYDAAGNRVGLSGPRGSGVFVYDAAGRMIENTDRLGNVKRFEYDAVGNPTAEIDALGNRTEMTYDALNRLVSRIDALGNVWTFEYCNDLSASTGTGTNTAAPPCGVTDPLGNTVKRELDAAGRVTRVTDALGHETVIEYDPRGLRTAVTDALGRVTRFEYDEAENLTAVVEADTARTEYTYDALDRLVRIRDAENRDWTRTYDRRGQLLTESDPLGNTTTFTYDDVGNKETETTANGELITYGYDIGRLTTTTLPGGVVEQFGYDAFGNRSSMVTPDVSVSFVYDGLLRLLETTNHTLGKTIGFDYDAAGRRTRMTTPESTVDYVYDALGRLVEQRDSITGTTRYAYDAIGRRTELRFANGMVTSYAYDAADRVQSVITRDTAGNVVDGYTYTYDAVGNRLSKTGLHDGETETYTYDDVDRLTHWARGAGRFETYGYDLVGNRKTLTDQAGSVTYAHDDADRLTSALRVFDAGGSETTTYSWDDSGNLLAETGGASTVTYAYDARDRLKQIENAAGVTTYGYDGDGMRVRESAPGEERRFLHAFEDIVAVYDGGGVRDTYLSHGPGIDEPLAQARAGEVRYLHHDALGSVTALSSPEGQLAGAVRYAAFGGVEAQSGDESAYGFTGRELDRTGLLYYRARYYQSDVGRFTTRDPFTGEPTVPGSLNDYAYVRGNPINRVDPSGESDLAAIIGALVLLIFAVVKLVVFEVIFHSLHSSHAFAFVLAFIVVLIAWELYNQGLLPWWGLLLEFVLLALATLALVHWPHGWIACKLLFALSLILLVALIANKLSKIGKKFDSERDRLQEKFHGDKYDLLGDPNYSAPRDP